MRERNRGPSMSDTATVATTPRTISSEIQPILPGFFPDPTICRVGDDYYLATSSFEYFPGAPIFHSRDLVSWTQIGNILTTRSQFRTGTPGPSTGVYGSTLRHHDGRFWFITTNVSDFSAGQVIVSAEDPAGPWSEPVFVPEAIGIDPDLCWDDDGVCYLTWHVLDFTVGGQGIRQAPIDLTTGRMLESSYPVWQGSGLPAAEGPHLFHLGEYWYILLAEGGTERGHCVTVARSRSPRGPFEACPENPVLTHRSTTHLVQSVGHADLVQTPDGSWAIVYLGSRPRGSTPGFHVLGRETFLAGVDWVEGWPKISEGRFDIPIPVTGFEQDFTAISALDAKWVVPDGEPDALVTLNADGIGFRSTGLPTEILCTRVRDLLWTADAVVEGGAELRLRMDDRHWCAIQADTDAVRVVVRIGDVTQEISRVPRGPGLAVLRLQARTPRSTTLPFGSAGPDDIVLAVDAGEGFTHLARLDGRYFSTEVAAGFTGRVLGLGSDDPHGRVRSFSYRPDVG